MRRLNFRNVLGLRLLPGFLAAAVLLAGTLGNSHSQVPAGYPGKAWHDSVQTLPGILQPAAYDEGAIGVTWFDTGPHIGGYTARNSWVDLDPVHVGDPTVPGSTVQAVAGNPYWGWLENNEWLKMTVNVKAAGTYTIHAMVGTAMTGTSFKVDALQGADSVSSGALVLPFPGTCPVECYHYWYFAKDLGHIALKAGVQVIRLQIVKSGYNIDYVDLELSGATGLREGKGRPGGKRSAHKASRLTIRGQLHGSAFDALGKTFPAP